MIAVLLASSAWSAERSARADRAGDPIEPVRTIVGTGARQIVVEQRGDEVVLMAVRAGATPRVLERWHDEERTVRATVRPFFGRADLLDVLVDARWTRQQQAMHAQRHYLLRTSGAADELACKLEGDSAGGSESEEHDDTVTIRKISDAPFTFAVTTARAQRRRGRTDSSERPRKSEVRYVIGATGTCAEKGAVR